MLTLAKSKTAIVDFPKLAIHARTYLGADHRGLTGRWFKMRVHNRYLVANLT